MHSEFVWFLSPSMPGKLTVELEWKSWPGEAFLPLNPYLPTELAKRLPFKFSIMDFVFHVRAFVCVYVSRCSILLFRPISISIAHNKCNQDEWQTNGHTHKIHALHSEWQEVNVATKQWTAQKMVRGKWPLQTRNYRKKKERKRTHKKNRRT